MKFGTASGSVYEVDEERRLFRRLSGPPHAVRRLPHDGEWRAFEAIFGPRVGGRCLVVWDLRKDLSLEATETSEVKWVDKEPAA